MSTAFKLNLPANTAHKTQNGKLLIVGGSKLFHAASLWSASIAAHLVDMVFYASTSENNELFKFAKNDFRDGIVIERQHLIEYAKQADVILLGPGMTRAERQEKQLQKLLSSKETDTWNLSPTQWQENTYLITNFLLAKFREKKFVLDAGALQMVEPHLLNQHCLLTPHQLEYEKLINRCQSTQQKAQLQQTTILKKSIVDQIYGGGKMLAEIKGGNAGLTKGGSGDVLAGTAAGLYCYNSAVSAAYWASRSIKAAAEKLYRQMGPFFTTTTLCQNVPATLWELICA